MLLTTEELFRKQNPQDGECPQWVKDFAIEFAKQHVNAAIKAAFDSAKEEWIPMNNSRRGYFQVNRAAIMTAYPLEQLK